MIFRLTEEVQKLMVIVATAYLIGCLNQRLLAEEMEILRRIVADGVLCTQQVYGHLDGPERLPKALDRIDQEVRARGVSVEPERLETLIEATVKAFKREFGDHWYQSDSACD